MRGVATRFVRRGRSRLKAKIDDLQAMIRERNREIAELRRQVDTQRDRPKSKP
jgi:hypothetical protein